MINKRKKENVKVSTCQYNSSCVRIKEQIKTYSFALLKKSAVFWLLCFAANLMFLKWCTTFFKDFFNLISDGTWLPRIPRKGLYLLSSSGLLRRKGRLLSLARTRPLGVLSTRYRSTAVKHNHFKDWLPAPQNILVDHPSITTLIVMFGWLERGGAGDNGAKSGPEKVQCFSFWNYTSVPVHIFGMY